MTKTYTMLDKEDKYVIADDKNNEILDIKKNTLSLDGKKLYDSVFNAFEKGDKIVLEKDKSIDNSKDKLSLAVYDNVKEIIDKIVTGINDSEETK